MPSALPRPRSGRSVDARMRRRRHRWNTKTVSSHLTVGGCELPSRLAIPLAVDHNSRVVIGDESNNAPCRGRLALQDQPRSSPPQLSGTPKRAGRWAMQIAARHSRIGRNQLGIASFRQRRQIHRSSGSAPDGARMSCVSQLGSEAGSNRGSMNASTARLGPRDCVRRGPGARGVRLDSQVGHRRSPSWPVQQPVSILRILLAHRQLRIMQAAAAGCSVRANQPRALAL